MKFEKIAVIGERDIALGFKLVGVKDIFIEEGEEAVGLLNEMLEKREYGLVIASNTMLDNMDTRSRRAAETSLKPIVVFIPVREEGDKESVEQLAKRVLGVDIHAL
ncbi:MAG: V-type ATP synthase subunit F [Candidatus Micrarchaeaceae archaeon]